MTGSTRANHRSARSPRPTPEGRARDNPIADPRARTTRSEPSAPASAGASGRHNDPVLSRPPRAPRSHPVKPGVEAPGMGKDTRASGKPTGARRATGPDETQRTTRGHEARQRGTPPARIKAHGQVPSSNGRRVPQTRRARTTRYEPRHENRCQATPAAVRTDVCAPGSEPSPWQLRNSRLPDGRVRAWRVPSPCRLRTDAVRMDECAPGSEPSPCGLRIPAVRMDECATPSNAPRTQPTAQHTEQAHR